MSARTPEEICQIFQRAMADGDIDAVISVYDPDVAFVSEAGEITRGLEDLRQELTPLVASRPRFAFTLKRVVETDGIALMHTQWTVSSSRTMTVHAIEVARRQSDGSWRWLIGDPYTVGKEVDS